MTAAQREKLIVTLIGDVAPQHPLYPAFYEMCEDDVKDMKPIIDLMLAEAFTLGAMKDGGVAAVRQKETAVN